MRKLNEYISSSFKADHQKGQFFRVWINGESSEVLSHYKFLALCSDGFIKAFKSKPQFHNGCWRGTGSKVIGVATWDEEQICDELGIPRNENQRSKTHQLLLDSFKVTKVKLAIWETNDGAVFNFDQILRRLKYVESWSNGFPGALVESRDSRNSRDSRIFRNSKDSRISGNSGNSGISLNESQKISFVDGDNVEIPNSYKFVAVDANGDICVYKEEPELDENGEYAVYKGKGKAQVGVAVWDWSKVDGNPKDFKSAAPKVAKLMPNFKFELEQMANVGDELERSGKFKIVFPKYGDIEKLD